MATKAEITTVLGMMAAANPRYTLTADTATVYANLLKDLPADLLKAAALQAICEVGFFPSVHELRKRASEIRRKTTGMPGAYEAWQDLRDARDGKRHEIIEKDGKYTIREWEYEWLHPIVPVVARRLGWPKTFPSENEMADRAHFVKAYDEEVRRILDDDLTLPEVKKFIESYKPPERLEAGVNQLSRVLKGEK